MNLKSKTGHDLNDTSKNDSTDENVLMEKLKLQNTALEKIKSAVLAGKGISHKGEENF